MTIRQLFGKTDMERKKWLQYAGAAGLPNKKMDIILKRLQERAKLYASIYFLPHMDLHPIHK